MKNFIKHFLIILGTSIGCTHFIGYSSTKEPTKVSSGVFFPSGAHVTLPKGVEYKKQDFSFEFRIGKEPISIHIIEYKKNIKNALQITKKELSLKDKEPTHALTLPELGWDSTHIEVFGPDKANEYIQIIGKNKAEFTWVIILKGTQAILDKRGAQIMTLIGSLTSPDQKTIDFSKLSPISIKEKETQLEDFVKSAMQKANVPGLSIALIEGSKIAYLKGFGRRNLEDTKKVNPDTRFMIGSVSKSMTTFLISTLVDKGILKWNDKVIDLYPNFTLKNKDFSKKLTLMDLACACTGIPRRDLHMILNHSGKNADNLMRDLSLLEQTTKLRETFQYNNQLVAASGFIAAKKARPNSSLNQSYNELMAKNVFAPMTMKRTTAKFNEAFADDNYSNSHTKDLSGDIIKVDFLHEKFAEYAGPSGGIWSTARDMANYAITELSRGSFNGQQVISEKGILFRRNKQVQINDYLYYGLGWMVGKNIGLDIVQHGGLTLGFSSEFVLFPEINRAVIILINSSHGTYIQGPILSKILELWFGKELKSEDQLNSNLDIHKQTTKQLYNKTFDLKDQFMTKFTGQHHNPEIGDIEIGKSNQGYFLKINENKYDLTGYQEDSGEKKLIATSLPVVGIIIEPVFSDEVSIKIEQGQEVYEFNPKKP